MFFNSIKWINMLRGEINRLVIKGMSNIYLKVAVEKNWSSQNSDFLNLKNLSPVSSWGAPTHEDITEFSNFLLQLRNQRSRRKTVRGFSVILILKEICQRVHVFCWTKIKTLIKIKWNRKWKISHTVLERRILIAN